MIQRTLHYANPPRYTILLRGMTINNEARQLRRVGLRKTSGATVRFKVQGCMFIVNSSQLTNKTAEDATESKYANGTHITGIARC